MVKVKFTRAKTALVFCVVSLAFFCCFDSVLGFTSPVTTYWPLPNVDGFVDFDSERVFTAVPYQTSDCWVFDGYYVSVSGANVTVNDLDENNKLLVADVAGASASSVVNFTYPSYLYPYLQTVTGEVSSISVDSFYNNRLIWSLDGSGDNVVTVAFPEGQLPLSLKIDGVERNSADVWTSSGYVATVNTVLGSVHSFELFFGSGASTPSGDDWYDSEPEEPTGEEDLFEDVVEDDSWLVVNLPSDWEDFLVLIVLVGCLVTVAVLVVVYVLKWVAES